MGGEGKGAGGSRRRKIDGAVKEKFLADLRDGLGVQAAAKAAGFALRTFYNARQADAAFDAAWAAQMRIPLDPGDADTRFYIAPGKGRRLQLHQRRTLRFTAARMQAFLSHFAGTCDALAAAAAAGVALGTVYRHRRLDADFAAAWDDALSQGYSLLEAEAVRQRLEVQGRLREGVIPAGEISAEFDRVLKLLAQWKRRDGRVAMRDVAPSRAKRWTFEEAMVALDKRLRSLKIPILGDEPDAQQPIRTPEPLALPSPKRGGDAE